MVGVGGECSQAVSGVVVDLAPQMLRVVQSIDKPVRMMVRNTASIKQHKIPASFPKPGAIQPSVTSVQQQRGGQVKAWGAEGGRAKSWERKEAG